MTNYRFFSNENQFIILVLILVWNIWIQEKGEFQLMNFRFKFRVLFTYKGIAFRRFPYAIQYSKYKYFEMIFFLLSKAEK